MVGYAHCPIYSKEHYDGEFEVRPVVWLTTRSTDQLIPGGSLLVGRVVNGRVLRIPDGKGGTSRAIPQRYRTHLRPLALMQMPLMKGIGAAYVSGSYLMHDEEPKLFGTSTRGVVICASTEVQAARAMHGDGCRVIEHFAYPGGSPNGIRVAPGDAKYRGYHWSALRWFQYELENRARNRLGLPNLQSDGQI